MYKAKTAKKVYVLSSTHQTISVDQLQPKKLPETVKSYNASEAGVDILDQMARYHIYKNSTKRWPVAVLFNIID